MIKLFLWALAVGLCHGITVTLQLLQQRMQARVEG